MRNPAADVERFLEALAQESKPGDRLPPIRELMKRFGASQAVVQRAFGRLKAADLIKSEVGRGTFFVGRRFASSASVRNQRSDPASWDAREEGSGGLSILLLRRSVSIVRGRRLIEGLHKVFVAEGARVLELSYTDPLHAQTVLKGLPRFDACVVQSTYRPLPIDLLAALRERCTVLAVDGLALAGSDVESVGTEWGEPLATAVAALRRLGHTSIAFATTQHPFLSTQLALRRFAGLMQEAEPPLAGQVLTLPLLPDEGYVEALLERLQASRTASGKLPFTALVAWGVEDGAAFRAGLDQLGIDVPRSLSVVLLGRADIDTEHAGFFDVVGSLVADQVQALHQTIHQRLASSDAPFAVTITPVKTRRGQSMAAPERARLAKAQR